MKSTSFYTKASRLVRWHRRGIGIFAAAVCFFAMLSVFSPAYPQSTDVVVATRTISADSTLQQTDLTTIAMPIDLVPEEALVDLTAAIGQVLTSTLTQRSVLTEPILLASLQSAEYGEHLVPFRVPDAATVGLLHVGDYISVVGSTVDGGVIDIADNVRVAALPTSDDGEWGTNQSGALIVVAAESGTAERLAAAASQMRMAIVMN